jgi:hypothetical protein
MEKNSTNATFSSTTEALMLRKPLSTIFTIA